MFAYSLELIKNLIRAHYKKRGITYHFLRGIIEPRYFPLCFHSWVQVLLVEIFGGRLYHFIGDSHTSAFEFHERMIVHHVGQATAHNLLKKQSSSNSNYIFWKILSQIKKERDLIITVFGEIDCRIHFFYQYKKSKEKVTIRKLMKKTIKNYLIILKKARKEGYKIAVLGVPPASKQKNIYKYLFYAPLALRSRINKTFNKMLLHECKKNGFYFIDVYSFSSDKRGFIRKEFARDEVHLNSRIVPFVKKQLEKFEGISQNGKEPLSSFLDNNRKN